MECFRDKMKQICKCGHDSVIHELDHLKDEGCGYKLSNGKRCQCKKVEDEKLALQTDESLALQPQNHSPVNVRENASEDTSVGSAIIDPSDIYNLSSEIKSYKHLDLSFLWTKDVKEFIKRLKESKFGFMIEEEINKLAGDELI